jgi:arsenate reductase
MPSAPKVTIFHNPQCGTSRNVLALIRNAGIEPEVIEYLKTPPTREKLRELVAQMGVPVRDVARQKEAVYRELGLDVQGDDALMDAMLAHPVLINRPIVVTPLATRLCRPSEAVLDILPLPQRGAFSKEDGEQVINERGAGAALHPGLVPSAMRLGSAREPARCCFPTDFASVSSPACGFRSHFVLREPRASRVFRRFFLPTPGPPRRVTQLPLN